MYRAAFELKRQKLILGHLPFLGISYQSREKDERYREKFRNKLEIKRVMKVALDYNVRFFSASSHGFSDLAPLHLEAIKEIEEEEETDITLIVCISIPFRIGGTKINDYRRWSTQIVYETKKTGRNILYKALNDPILNCRPRWKENIRYARPYSVTQIKGRLNVEWRRWESSIDMLSEWRIGWIEPGSEVDFISLARTDLVGEIIDRTREAGYRCLLGSHHLGATAPILQDAGIEGFDGYVTPINKMGVMMFPSREIVERIVVETRRGGKMIIATKPLAGGRIKPEEAFSYVFQSVGVDACMVGVASTKEAKEDFETAKKVLSKKKH